MAKETHVKYLFAAKILNAFGRFLDLIWESQESLLYAKVCGERKCELAIITDWTDGHFAPFLEMQLVCF